MVTELTNFEILVHELLYYHNSHDTAAIRQSRVAKEF